MSVQKQISKAKLQIIKIAWTHKVGLLNNKHTNLFRSPEAEY